MPVRSGNAGPELSPDASQVAYTDLDAGGAAQLFVVPVEGAAPRALHPCRTRCDFRWESDTTLSLVHGEALVRVSTTGAAPQTVVPRGVRTALVGGGS